MTKKSTFARNFRFFRERARLGQEALADSIGVNVRTISVYETGKGYPKVDLLVKISEILNVPVEHFFAEDPEKIGKSSTDTSGLSLSPESPASAQIKQYRDIIIACQQLLDDHDSVELACAKLIDTLISATDELEKTHMRNKEIETKLRYATELISSIAGGKS